MTLDFNQARFNMVEQQVRPWDVSDPSVLMAMESVQREDYVPAAWRGLATADTEVELGHGERMFKPNHDARVLQAVRVQAGERVLEIGTGSGYLAACLSTLGAQVDSVDIHEDFTKQARARLDAHGIDNVSLATADASAGWGQAGWYNVIIVTGSVPNDTDAFTRGLTDGGRLWIVVGEGDVMEAQLITRRGDEFIVEGQFETVIKPLENRASRAEFQF